MVTSSKLNTLRIIPPSHGLCWTYQCSVFFQHVFFPAKDIADILPVSVLL